MIVAAGQSSRMGAGPRKPLADLEGAPVLERCCAAFDAAPSIAEIVLVVQRDDIERVERWCAERSAFAKVRAVVEGGATRSESVRKGLRWCAFGPALIAVHDAARPLVEPAAIERCLAAAATSGGALLALPARDTLKRSADGQRSAGTLERDGIWCAQTPQAFEARGLRELAKRAAAEGFEPTDEAALWERYRGPVELVEGATTNFKITRPEDLELARALVRWRAGPGEARGAEAART